MEENISTKVINIWKFIEFTDQWGQCDTSRLDEISPSWFRRKTELEKSSDEYNVFIDQLKRRHAIETGVIERLYDISKGVTETLIEKGFADVLISHGDFNDDITKEQLLNHLRDNLNAVDHVFNFVKSERELTVGFINELHQVVTAHQNYAEGRDQFGAKFKIPLIKGRFKERENNPSRIENDTKITYKYCPPEHVSAEMDRLIAVYSNLVQQQVHAVVIAGWFHHAFSIIHPYQDGNGRLARLLASLILIKSGFFPLTVAREEAKDMYLKSLEDADKGSPQPLISYFCEIQKANIEKALNLKPVSRASFDELTGILSEKLKVQKEVHEKERQLRIEQNRRDFFRISDEILNKLTGEIRNKLQGLANIYLTGCGPDDAPKQHYFTYQIVNFAKNHEYYYNRFLPKFWFRLVFELSQQKMYQLVVTLHHFGYEDDSFAVGAFLEFIEPEDETQSLRNFKEANFRKGAEGLMITSISLPVKPYKLSLDVQNGLNERKANLETYITEIMTVALAQIVSEVM